MFRLIVNKLMKQKTNNNLQDLIVDNKSNELEKSPKQIENKIDYHQKAIEQEFKKKYCNSH